MVKKTETHAPTHEEEKPKDKEASQQGTISNTGVKEEENTTRKEIEEEDKEEFFIPSNEIEEKILGWLN